MIHDQQDKKVIDKLLDDVYVIMRETTRKMLWTAFDAGQDKGLLKAIKTVEEAYRKK